MLKKRWILFSFSIVFVLSGCATKVAPPPVYERTSVTLEEIIRDTGKEGITSLKAITDIEVTVDGGPHSEGSASAILMKPDLVHIKAYKFGLLVGDIIINNGETHVKSGKVNATMQQFSKELYDVVFWWDDMRDAEILRSGEEYILQKRGKSIHLDSSTLLPTKQEIYAYGRDILIMYSEPAYADGFWYQSLMEITMENYKFNIEVDKLRLNPEVSESEFDLP
jgi:hypothetical protein